MIPAIRSAVCRYGMALSSVTLALLLTWLLKPFFAATPALVFVLAVIGSIWYGGLRTGILATLASQLCSITFFLHRPTLSA
jgi:hypothetical protein